MAEVIVVGGGILGLTLARRLSERGHHITVLEGAAVAGGLAAPQDIGGFTWDRFYHVILESDTQLLRLLGELGLRDRVQWGTTRTGFWTDGRMHAMSSSLDFLRFPPLNLLDKARLAATIFAASRIRDGLPLEAERVEDWLRRWSGSRTFDRIWQPLLEAKLGANWSKASASFIWAIIARMYAARRTGLKRERFGYLSGGYDAALAALRADLNARGVALVTNMPVQTVTGTDGQVSVQAADRTFRADAAVLTVPCTRLGTMCPQLTADERARLGRVEYQGVLCLSLLLDRPLGGYYVTNITDRGLPFTAIIEMTALVDRSVFGGHSLVYLPRYLARDDALWGADDATIIAQFTAGLRRMYPSLPPTAVRHAVVSRAREVQAIPTVHYSRDALPPIRTSVPGVFVATSAQIVNGTLNANETVGLAERGASQIAEMLP